MFSFSVDCDHPDALADMMSRPLLINFIISLKFKFKVRLFSFGDICGIPG